MPSIGSLFAGIGGFDLGFERAGWTTSWQVEINSVNRAVLADRFPHARQFADVREVGAHCLSEVDAIIGGFPCQDISTSGQSRGKQPGLNGARSGLFFQVVRLLKELRPTWVVLENVPALLHSNDCADFEKVIQSLAGLGYLGCWRVLDARYFGSPCVRRRIFLVGGLGRLPPLELLSDAGPMEAIPSTFAPGGQPWTEASGWGGHTLQAFNAAGRISLGCELLVAEEDRFGSMADRQRTVEVDGLCRGLDAANLAEAFSAGNAVHPAVAEWIARKLIAG